jgi:hypothetical protein
VVAEVGVIRVVQVTGVAGNDVVWHDIAMFSFDGGVRMSSPPRTRKYSCPSSVVSSGLPQGVD